MFPKGNLPNVINAILRSPRDDHQIGYFEITFSKSSTLQKEIQCLTISLEIKNKKKILRYFPINIALLTTCYLPAPSDSSHVLDYHGPMLYRCVLPDVEPRLEILFSILDKHKLLIRSQQMSLYGLLSKVTVIGKVSYLATQ